MNTAPKPATTAPPAFAQAPDHTIVNLDPDLRDIYRCFGQNTVLLRDPLAEIFVSNGNEAANVIRIFLELCRDDDVCNSRFGHDSNSGCDPHAAAFKRAASDGSVFWIRICSVRFQVSRRNGLRSEPLARAPDAPPPEALLAAPPPALDSNR